MYSKKKKYRSSRWFISAEIYLKRLNAPLRCEKRKGDSTQSPATILLTSTTIHARNLSYTTRQTLPFAFSYFSKHSTKALITAFILHPNIIHSSQWADMLNAQLVAEEGARQKRTQWKKHTWPRPKPLQLNYDCLASKRGCVHSLR